MAVCKRIVLTFFLVLASCSHGQKKTTPELDRLAGKKVALVGIEGEAKAKAIAEVALINQLAQGGDFILISKQDLDTVRARFEQDPTAWRKLARDAGADYALKMKVIDFTADTHEGYSSEIVDDSEMAAERGEKERMTERTFKAKSIEGRVKFELQFTGVNDEFKGDVRSGFAEASSRVVEDEKNGGIHLPPKLRYLETLSNEAFAGFFKHNR